MTMMTPDEFRNAISKLQDGDTEGEHEEMDELMCCVLRELGYHEGIAIFVERNKWYA